MALERRRIGEILIEAGVLNEEQLNKALSIQKEDGRRLGSILLAYGFVAEPQLVQALSQQLSVPWVSLWHVDVPEDLLELVPMDVARECSAVPVYVRTSRETGPQLYVALDDPTNEEALSRVSQAAKMPVKAMVAGPTDIASAIADFYGGAEPPPAGAPVPRAEAKTLEIVPDIQDIEGAEEGRLPDTDEYDAVPAPTAPEPEAEAEAEYEVPAPSAYDVPPPASPPSRAAEDVEVVELGADEAEEAEEVEAVEATEPDETDEIVTLEEAHVVDSDEDESDEEPVAELAEESEAAPAAAEEAEEVSEAVEAAAEEPAAELDAEVDAEVPDAEPDTVEVEVPPADEAEAEVTETAATADVDEVPDQRPRSTPAPRRPRAFALTLLDGTTINLSGAKSQDEAEGIKSVPELVALLRASGRGEPSSKKLPSRHWEFYVAALLELLVRKRILTEEEVLESLLK